MRGSSDRPKPASSGADGSVLEVTLRPSTSELRPLSQQAEAFAARHRVRRDRIDAMLLALEEAVTNVLLYAFAGMPDAQRELVVRLRMTAAALVVTILDNGAAFDPTQAAPRASGADDGSVGGWGIALIRGSIDEVHYTRLGDRNQLELVVHTGGA